MVPVPLQILQKVRCLAAASDVAALPTCSPGQHAK
jgi:hypothetical protein